MKHRIATMALGLGIALAIPAMSQAAPGAATGNVNLRAGPGTNYARIGTIPRGAPVNVLRCGRWCEVVYAGRKGWASASYFARGAAPYRGGYAVLPDPSLCHGPGVWSNPYCEPPIERSAREFARSTIEYQNRQHGGRRR